MSQYILSPAAQNRLKNIRQYSLDNFGKQQTRLYLTRIRKALRELAQSPSSGTKRDDIKQGYYSQFIGSHTIYYRIHDTHIDILDILHQKMEPKYHL